MATQAMTRPTQAVPERTQTRAAPMFSPLVDIIEKSDEWLLVADLPGSTTENIDVDYDRGTLTIRASVQNRPHGGGVNYLLREYGVGDYVRSFEIGEGIDAGRLHAEFRDGVLTLHLPKAEAAKARKITVNAG